MSSTKMHVRSFFDQEQTFSNNNNMFFDSTEGFFNALAQDFATAAPVKPDGKSPVTSSGTSNSTMAPPTVPPVDTFYNDQWHFGFMGDVETIWQDFNGSGVRVGVYDDGLQYTHPDLAANYDASLQVIVNGQVIDPLPTSASDAHGTSVAGLIVAANNGEGVVGVAWGASLTGVDIFSGPADINNNFAGFLQAADQLENFDVVNHSWGSFPSFNPLGVPGDQAYIAEYFEALAQGRGGLGTLQVQAAGNDAANADGDFTNSSRATITVAAYDDDGDASFYSNHGASLLLSAPTSGSSAAGNARQVTTDLVGADGYGPGDYLTTANGFGGTSGATPLVAGAIAVMLDANENLGWRDVQKILAYSSTELGGGIGSTPTGDEGFAWYYNGADNWNGGGLHFSEDYGYGSLNLYNAVRMAEVWDLFDMPLTSANEDSFTSAFSNIGAPLTSLQTININFTIAQDIELEYLDFTVGLTHTWLPDLVMTLISPDGTSVQIFNQDGNQTLADNGWNWTFGINALRGEMSAGTWTLQVSDVFNLDDGVLDSITFTAHGRDGNSAGVNLDDDVYHYTDEVFDALADDASRQTLTDTGGTDWLNFAAITGNIVANMAAGGISTINGANFLTIAAGTVIENAVGGDGADRFNGSNGDNIIYGMRGDDDLRGNRGSDELYGGDGNDQLRGGGQSDQLYGEAGADKLYGNGGADLLYGADGNDQLRGGGGNDDLFGEEGNDLLLGQKGNDDLFGGAGNDRLQGNQGTDNLWGEDGDDDFIFKAGFDIDRIKDFSGGDDINLRSFNFTDLNAALANASQVGSDVVFDFGGGDQLIIENIQLADLDASNVLF